MPDPGFSKAIERVAQRGFDRGFRAKLKDDASALLFHVWVDLPYHVAVSEAVYAYHLTKLIRCGVFKSGGYVVSGIIY